ncbi:MAG: thioesterase family protein [Chloroflexi bacterium]|nr:thioesterase family protein [Chloroflexota bacterium]
MPDAVFRRDGDHFIPTRLAASAWGESVLHGGPPCGLLARAIEHAAPAPGLHLARLTVDLFRAVPLASLEVRTEAVRTGRRIVAIRASILAEGVEVARAHGVLLRPTASDAAVDDPPPPGPDGIETLTLSRRPPSEPLPPGMPPGFHAFVETRWLSAPGDDRPGAWFRMPWPLVEGEETTPTQRAASLADFGNALAGSAGEGGRPSGGAPTAGMINTDVTLYMSRPPRGEWLCLRLDQLSTHDGLGFVAIEQFDADGRFGHSVQARLANPRRTDDNA